MKRLQTGVAVLLFAGVVSGPLSEAALRAEETAKAREVAATDAGAATPIASKAAADALLAPSNLRKFAASKAKDRPRSKADSVGGNAAADAATGVNGEDPEHEDESADADEIPLPVRKPKNSYGIVVKPDPDSVRSTQSAPAANEKAKQPPAQAQPAQTPPAQAQGKPEPDKGKAGTKQAEGGKKPADATQWSPLEIELAKARCTQLLKGLDVVAVPEEPFRKGECGAAAPVRLVSIGKNPEVSISPPALLTCDMVVGLHKWLKGDLQPLAQKHLGTEIVRIEAMSDYSCRRAYGRVANRLSEHAKANALDIRGFVTAKAKTAYVLEAWGQTRRDVVAQIAQAKAQAEKEEAARLEAEKQAQQNLRDPKAPATAAAPNLPPAAVGLRSGAPAGGLAKTTIIDGLPKLTVTLPGAMPAKPGGAALAPRHLGGPKPAEAPKEDEKQPESGKQPAKAAKAPGKASQTASSDAVPFPAPRTATSRFLHEAHVAACRIFGTTLGPEANEAHRNHFHIDMAPRKLTKICD